MSIIRRQIQKEALNLSQARKIISVELILISLIINNLSFASEKTNDSSNLKGISTEKRAGELKAEIPMGISKSWIDLIISCNKKFITLKISWPSWVELCWVLGRELRGSLGFDPHFRGHLILYINVIILVQIRIINPGFWGLLLGFISLYFWYYYNKGTHFRSNCYK